MKIFQRVIKIFSVTIAIIVLIYTFCCYTSNAFVSKWRQIYVETALSTMTHQWLATSLLPPSVVEAVRISNQQFEKDNLIDKSEVITEIIPKITLSYGGVEGLDPETKARIEFTQMYPEIDISTMPKDTEYDGLAMSDISNLNIKTTAGDIVHTIDTINKLLIINIKGDNFVGKLAIVKDPSAVSLEVCRYSYQGDRVEEICFNNGGILAVNASGFADPNWHGAGNIPVGLVKSNGNLIQSRLTKGNWFVCGLDYDDNFHIGTDVKVEELRDGVEFRPAVIVNGESRVKGSAGWGLQPRTVVGQNARKDILLLTVDGRRVGYSIGATMEDCSDVLMKYNATQAINMDGGSSTVMVYNTGVITRSSSGSTKGRHVPNAWVVNGVKMDYTDKLHGKPISEVEEILEIN